MPLRDDLLNPIPGDNPSGENLRYAPIYDQIKEARREEEDIAQGEWQRERKKADWVLTSKLCSEALAKKSKDLQIAAWLTEAHLRREGYGGLLESLELLRNLLENFWDTLYPEIEDGDLEMRATPLEWVGSRLDKGVKLVTLTRTGLDWFNYRESRSVPYETDSGKAEQRAQAIAEHKLTPEEFDAAFDESPKGFYEDRMQQLTGCLESLDALAEFCDEKFADYSPNLGSLKKTLEEVKQVVHVLLTKKKQQESGGGVEQPVAASDGGWGDSSEAAETPAESSWSDPQPSYTAAAAAPARALARPKGPLAPEPVDRDDAIARVAGAARWLRQNDAYNPAGYLLVRALRWGELRVGAPEPDAALLEAPPTEVRQEVKRLASEGYWQEALDAVENALAEPCGRAWLDAQRYAVQACENIGYSAVAAAIKSELRALLTDIPSLVDRSLMDDTPTANAETRQWIADQVGTVAPAAAPANDWYSAPTPEPDPEQQDAGGEERPPDAYDMAMQAMRSGDARGAVDILSQEAAQAPCGRVRFQRRVQLAQVCLGAGHPEVAMPILESLAEEIDRRKLEDWEPADTVAHALGLMYRAIQNTEMSPEEKHKLYSRICRLDPVQALGLAR
ncbi:MAG TPA: type VI secretion system protein TssA [Bryobacteraceae bacterium]|nr:type VI secretion system protein TssA [Bryobacteraceae bacterium]